MKSPLIIRLMLVFVLLACVPALPVLAGEAAPYDASDDLDQIREKIAINGYGFEVGHTPIFDKGPEARAEFLGRRVTRLTKGAGLFGEEWFAYEGSWAAIPASYDIRNIGGKSFIGPVRDQGDCGSCYAFAAAAAAEGAYNMALERTGIDTIDFSESYIAWHLGQLDQYSSHFGGCDDADYTYAEVSALTKEGIIQEEDFPYTTQDPGIFQHAGDAPVVFSAWGRVASGDIDAIKAAIMTYGSVVAAVYAGPAFLAYKSGIYEDANTACTSIPSYYTPTNHAVALVGWNDNGDPENAGYWILRNSWGVGWGEGGYMRIKYRSARVSCAVAYLEPADWPVVQTGGVISVTEDAAIVMGEVDPQGQSTQYWVEYGEDRAYGQSSPSYDAGSEEGRKLVFADLTSLEPQTTHHYRLVAYNGSEFSYGADRTFTTAGDPMAPGVQTLDAVRVAAHSAELQGSVLPRGADTRYQFEYGATTYYGLRTAWKAAGPGTSQVAATTQLNGLEPYATYHFRIKAENSYGVSYGPDMVFMTDASINVWSQLPDAASTLLYTSQVDPAYPFDAKSMDDFQFDTEVGVINKVRWWSRQLRADPVTPEAWNISIYKDNGAGRPGDKAAGWTVAAGQCHESVFYRDKDIFEYWTNLEPGFTPQAGTRYWIMIQAKCKWTPQVYWMVSKGDVNLNAGVSIFPEVGIPAWTPHSPGADHAFELFVDVTSTGNATTGNANEITSGSAYVTGTVRPPGEGSVIFQYGRNGVLGYEMVAQEYTVSKSGDARGSRQQGVGAYLTGLAPGTTYQFRVAVMSGGGAYFGSINTFTTLEASVPQSKAESSSDMADDVLPGAKESGGGGSAGSGGGGGGGCFVSSLDSPGKPIFSAMAVGLSEGFRKAAQMMRLAFNSL